MLADSVKWQSTLEHEGKGEGIEPYSRSYVSNSIPTKVTTVIPVQNHLMSILTYKLPVTALSRGRLGTT